MARLLVDWELYATVTRDNTVIVERRGHEPRAVSAEDAAREILSILRDEGVVVLDEFQRLLERYWQMLALAHPDGTLVLVASSLGVVNKVFSTRSPLLGLVAPVRIGLISLGDAITSLVPRLGPLDSVLWGVLLREPWLSAMPGVFSAKPWEWIADSANLLYSVAQSLVGEVFSEEERRLTRLYEAVLRLLGAGVWDSRTLATILHQRGLIETPSPSTVTGVLEKLGDMGLVVKTRLWRTRGKRVYYRHSSPLLAIVYGLAEKHAIDEYPQALGTLRETALALYARELQFSLAELLAEHHGGIPSYTILPHGEGDVDIVVLDKAAKKPIAAYEVKMGTCRRSDYLKTIERARKTGAEKIGIICLRGAIDKPPASLETLFPEDIVRIAISNTRKAIKTATL